MSLTPPSSTRKKRWIVTQIDKTATRWALVLIFVTAANAIADTRFVSASASGADNGTSWADAFVHLQDALAVAQAGDEIWVAAGTYKPDLGANQSAGDRHATFTLIDGVALYGGFAGTESDLSQRNVVTNVTVLSGDLLGDDVTDLGAGLACYSSDGVAFSSGCEAFDVEPPGGDGDIDSADLNLTDNSYHVVTGTATDATAILDGFHVTAGNADFLDVEQSAGGIGLGSDSSAQIRHCVIRQNHAVRFGGGISSNGPISVVDSRLEENRSGERGGAWVSFGGAPLARGCTFEGNVCNDTIGSFGWGGAFQSNNSDGTMIEDCLFRSNYSNNPGGAIYFRNGVPLVDDCRFENNTSSQAGAGITLVNGCDAIITHCVFLENEGGLSGGGIAVTAGRPQIQACLFEGNTCGYGGCAVSMGIDQGDVEITLTDCDFVENAKRNVYSGGGAVEFKGTLTHIIQGCRFTRNTAPGDGGALYVSGLFGIPTVLIANSIFEGNQASTEASSGAGGAIYNEGQLECTNTIFVGNTALGVGSPNSARAGAVRAGADGSEFVNCTFVSNEATQIDGGGAIRTSDTSVGANCIFWDNHADGVLQHIQGASLGPDALSYSIIQDDDPNDASIPFDGATNHNLDDDPLFLRLPDPGPDGQWGSDDDDYGDLRLSSLSPALDAGDNGAVIGDFADVDCDGNRFEPTPFDKNGNPRFVDDPAADTGNGAAPVIDIGAYERGPLDGQQVYVDADATGANDGSSWADAFTDLQDALGAAVGTSCGAIEIWVAEGTYTPDRGSANRGATFQLRDHVGVFGGFVGGETLLSQRDPAAHPTILSGDLIGDDDNGANIADNSYHVVTGTGTSGSAILDGVIISGGNADFPTSGAGLTTVGGGPTIRNCTLRDNTGECATALDSRGGTVEIDGVSIQSNNPSMAGSLGISQSDVALSGNLTVPDGRIEVFESDFSGAGAIDLGPTSLLTIRNVAACDAELIIRSLGTLGASTIFSTIDQPEWNLSASLDETFVLGAESRWVIAPSWATSAALTWSGNVLSADLSVGGLAEAEFLDGGTLTIAGQLYDSADQQTANLIHDGILLTADVGAFHVKETVIDSNTLAFIESPELTPTGGFLVENGLDFILAGRQSISLQMSAAQQDGGDLFDFNLSSSISLTGTSQLEITPVNPPQGATILRSRIIGTGQIEIDPGASLIISDAGELNLSGETEPACDGQDAPGTTVNGGTAIVNGTLIVRDNARVRNTNVQVNGLGFENDNTIVHNDIRLVESSTGFGGEFFVADNAVLSCNNIISEGDRYLDLDPDPDDGQSPTFLNNAITVIIKQGVNTVEGELLELRAVDHDFSLGAGESGYYQVPASAGYDDIWALERLEIEPGAKLTLTNRQGFVFQDPGITTPETLYVRNLVLGDNAVLNLGLQRIYYQTLTLGAGAEIVNSPLLGFSLVTIGMEDQTEFDVRVRQRVTDTNDTQPDPPALPKRGSISRVDDPMFGGIMEMKTKADGDFETASSVAAHGAFARAAEDKILVTFDYLFCGNSDDELIVNLTDSPHASTNLVEVARVYPPAPGRAGAIGSNRLAKFFGTFPRGGLNFTRGTYVELELRGDNACVEIDNWDPDVRCTEVCLDLSGDRGLSNQDFLYLLADYGQEPGYSEWCLDNQALSADQYVEMTDLLSWDTFLDNPPAATSCGLNAADAAGAGVAPNLPANEIIVAGKRAGAGLQEDDLYPIDANGLGLQASERPASAPGNFGYRANTRLAKDANGDVYQIHATQGLIRLGNAEVAVPPLSVICSGGSIQNCEEGDEVLVGVVPLNDGTGGEKGVPIFDVAFDRTDPDVLFVAPVVIIPANGSCPYKAAAMLHLNPQPGGGYAPPTLLTIYGENPAANSTVTGGCSLIPDPDKDRVREIEVDGQGNVYVLSAQAINDNDWLLVFDDTSGAERLTVPLHSAVPQVLNPIAMHVSADGSTMFLASGNNAPDATSVELHRYDLDAVSPSITYDGTYDIVGMRHVVSVVEAPAQGGTFVIGFTGPVFGEFDTFDDMDALFTTPVIAPLSAVPGPLTATTINADNLALPISAVFNERPLCPKGDLDDDGSVSYLDIAPFVAVLLDPAAATATQQCTADTNTDGQIDGGDIQRLIELLGAT